MTSKKSAISSALEESIAKLVSDELVGRITATVLAKLEGRTDISEADEDSHRLGYAKSGNDGFAVIAKTGGVPMKLGKKAPSEPRNGDVVTVKPAKKTSKKSTPKPSKKAKVTPKGLAPEGPEAILLASPRNAKFLCCSEGTKFGKPTGKACLAWFASLAKAKEHQARFNHEVIKKSSLRDQLAKG